MTAEQSVKAEPAFVTAPSTSTISGLTLFACPEQFREAVREPIWRWTALNFPVHRMLHLLTPASLMVRYTPTSQTAQPVLMAGRSLPVVDDKPAPYQLAISHIAPPQIAAVAKVLPHLLPEGETELLTTTTTAAGLAKALRHHPHLHITEGSEAWTYYRLVDDKPAEAAAAALLPGTRFTSFNTANPPPRMGNVVDLRATSHQRTPHPTEVMMALVQTETGLQVATMGGYVLPGQRKLVVGDTGAVCEGAPELQARLFNRLSRMCARNGRRIDLVLPQCEDPRRSLPGHKFACEVPFRLVGIQANGLR